MKSAYELAMEKLQKESPDQSLSDEKKAELAELDNLYKSKLAEREVFLGGKIAEAEAGHRGFNVGEWHTMREDLGR